ncbi:putative nudix hydrolase 6 [Trichinella zimbabwensis]|uniref:Putative nudix hydrolase 6 n=1 Tax=Trichinella zimbabwensis TaxID=268475 RepID=A0A0V1HQ78_9BILA|nr:putative nudix hydrolase 6 [Trichinella zimbabwensis]
MKCSFIFAISMMLMTDFSATTEIKKEPLQLALEDAFHLTSITSTVTKDKLLESADAVQEETCDKENVELLDLIESAGNLNFSSMAAQKSEKLSNFEEDILIKLLKRPLNELIQVQQPGKPYYTVKKVLTAELCDASTMAFSIKLKKTTCSVSQNSKSLSCILLVKGSRHTISSLLGAVCDKQLKATISKKYSLCEISKYPHGDKYSLYVPSSVMSWKKDLFLYKPVDYDSRTVFDSFQNPRGRTGMKGIGGLQRFGQNEKVMPLVVRKHEGKTEMLTVMKSSGSWQFPQYFVNNFKSKPLGKQIEDALNKYFQSIGLSEGEIKEKLAEIYADVHEVPVKLPTEPMDTDQAWLITHVVVVFDKKEKHIGSVAFDSSSELGWKEIDKDMLKVLRKLPTKSSDNFHLGSQNPYSVVYKIVPLICAPAGALFLYSWYVALPIIVMLFIIYVNKLSALERVLLRSSEVQERHSHMNI